MNFPLIKEIADRLNHFTRYNVTTDEIKDKLIIYIKGLNYNISLMLHVSDDEAINDAYSKLKALYNLAAKNA